MKKAIVSVGISASGKSTDAAKWLAEHEASKMLEGYEHAKNPRMEINRDSIRKSIMENNGQKFSWDKWNWKNEGAVTKNAEGQLSDAALHGIDVYISDTNLNPKYRAQTIRRLEDYGYEVEVREFPVTLEEALVRDRKRENSVGEGVIEKQFLEWVEYKLQYSCNTPTI